MGKCACGCAFEKESATVCIGVFQNVDKWKGDKDEMKRTAAFLLALVLLAASIWYEPADFVRAEGEASGTENFILEAEDGQILFGKIKKNSKASGGQCVTLGEDKPEGETSGIVWTVNAQSSRQSTVTVHYSEMVDSYVHFICNGNVQNVYLPAGQNRVQVQAGLAEGVNQLMLLYSQGGPIVLDRLSLEDEGISLVHEEPLKVSETQTFYFSRNARINMGKPDAGAGAVSGTCVAGLTYNSGNGITSSAHVEFDNVYAANDGIYQLIVFVAADAGNNVEVCVNGQSFVLPVNLPQGKDNFVNGAGERSHAVVRCQLYAGNNQVLVRGAENTDVKIDMLSAELIHELPERPETANLEAEAGRVYFGKYKRDSSASGGEYVILGEDKPENETSGILWWVNAESNQTAVVTVYYAAKADTEIYFVSGSELQTVFLPAGRTSRRVEIGLSEGVNLLQLLYAAGGPVTVDRVTLDVEGLSLVKEEPLKVSDTQTFYFSRNARINMGKVDGAGDAVSTTCVAGLTYNNGNSIMDSAHVNFDNVYIERGGIYQLIIFAAADAGASIEVCIDGQSQVLPVLLPMGKDSFRNEKDERSHVVLEYRFSAGYHQIAVRGKENSDVKIDMLSVQYLNDGKEPEPNPNRYEAENARLTDVQVKGKGQMYDYGTYSGTGFVGNIDTGSSEVRFSVYVEEAGEYEVYVCYASGVEGVVPTFRIYTGEGYYGEVELANLTGWGNFGASTVACARVSLKAGNNEIIIKKGQHNAELDYIELGAKVGDYKDPIDKRNGYTRYEAEDAKFAGVVKKGQGQEVDYGTYSGTGFVGNIDLGSSEVRFSVQVEREGEYELCLCYASSIEEGTPTFRVFTGEGYYGEVELKNITGWGNFSLNTIASFKVSLRAGNNEIIIKKGKYNAELDFIELGTRLGDYKAPIDKRNGYTRYEAENAILTAVLKKGKGQEYDYGTYSGTGFVGNIDTDASEVRFLVQVEQDGEYELCVCYAAGTEGVTPTFHVFTQNGYYGQIELPNVTGWGNFGPDTIAVMKISLKAGENEVIIKKAQHNAELDFIEIGPRTGAYKEPISDGDNSLEFEIEDNNFKALSVARKPVIREEQGFPLRYVITITAGAVLIAAAATVVIILFIKQRKKDGNHEE